MSDENLILIVQSDGGVIDAVERTHPARVMYLDLRELDDRNEWYCRDTLVEAECWTEEWKEKYNNQIEWCISVVEEAGIEPPQWVMAKRNSRLMGLLSDIESL